MKPFVLVQLSDPHIGATWAAADPLSRVRASVAAVRRLPDQPDAMVVSGDLADHGTPDEYALLKATLGALGVPVHVVPGNHDDRAALRGCFGLPGSDATPVDYMAEAGSMRLFMLDSTIPGADRGDLRQEQLHWLQTGLAAAPEKPALLVMHHPPLRTGVAALDAIGLSERARLDIERTVASHPQIRGIVAGHFHRTIASRIGDRAALTAPSTYTQLAIDPAADELRPVEDEPPAFLVHRLLGNEFLSYVQTVPGD